MTSLAGPKRLEVLGAKIWTILEVNFRLAPFKKRSEFIALGADFLFY